MSSEISMSGRDGSGGFFETELTRSFARKDEQLSSRHFYGGSSAASHDVITDSLKTQQTPLVANSSSLSPPDSPEKLILKSERLKFSENDAIQVSQKKKDIADVSHCISYLKSKKCDLSDEDCLNDDFGNNNTSEEEEEEDSEEASDEEEEEDKSPKERFCIQEYDASQYSDLTVSTEVKELFSYIARYRKHSIDIDIKLKPFIPEFIPAVGEVDAFLKIPRPDGKTDGLGLLHLDEPASRQSDPPVLELKLRAISKHTNMHPIQVRYLENGEKNTKEITNWVNQISELHRTRPRPTVLYSKRMPEIESLMQVWHPDFETEISSSQQQQQQQQNQCVLTFSELDITLEEYVHLLCSLLGIPCYNNLTESLHVFWTLYLEFRENQHFKI